jgi:hypothetical protein
MDERSRGKRPLSLIAAPVPVCSDERRKPPFTATGSASCSELLRAWLHYHAIQLRWDLERWLARLFHRPWIDPRRHTPGRQRRH